MKQKDSNDELLINLIMFSTSSDNVYNDILGSREQCISLNSSYVSIQLLTDSEISKAFVSKTFVSKALH